MDYLRDVSPPSNDSINKIYLELAEARNKLRECEEKTLAARRNADKILEQYIYAQGQRAMFQSIKSRMNKYGDIMEPNESETLLLEKAIATIKAHKRCDNKTLAKLLDCKDEERLSQLLWYHGNRKIDFCPTTSTGDNMMWEEFIDD